MEKILEIPNLPTGIVSRVIIGENNNKTKSALQKLGIIVIETTCSTNVHPNVATHADLQFCHLKDDIAVVASEQTILRNLLYDLDFSKVTFCEKSLGDEYPDDVLLNCAFVNDCVIYNPETVSEEILSFIKNSDLTEITVNQGYTKCSVAIVSDNAIITEDVSIASKAAEAGLHVLLIRKGYVKLKGYDYGFIGGCCGKISKDTLAFNGDIKLHPDYKEINKFLKAHKVKPYSLFKGELEDIGSIIPLMQISRR